MSKEGVDRLHPDPDRIAEAETHAGARIGHREAIGLQLEPSTEPRHVDAPIDDGALQRDEHAIAAEAADPSIEGLPEVLLH